MHVLGWESIVQIIPLKYKLTVNIATFYCASANEGPRETIIQCKHVCVLLAILHVWVALLRPSKTCNRSISFYSLGRLRSLMKLKMLFSFRLGLSEVFNPRVL